MKTVADNRRDWLQRLIEKHGSIAALNLALGRAKTDATLSQIRNQSPHNTSGKPRTMGDKIAREIEQRLSMVHGIMDAPVDTNLSANLVAEPQVAYGTPAWPFITVSEAEWKSIP